MKHGSLFSGIGGFDLAAEWMGWENVFHCEWMEFPRKVLEYYWPDADSHIDICKTDFKKYANKIDILTGGFPCQPFSLAGKRKGTEDERYLWGEMLRAIQEIKPKFVIAENVYGITNIDGGLVFEQVCLDLETEGYEVQPFIIPAASKNAPHRRDRVWFIATNTNCNGFNKCNGKDEINPSKGGINALGDVKQSDVDGDATHSNSRRTQARQDGEVLGESNRERQTRGFINDALQGDATNTLSTRLLGGYNPREKNFKIRKDSKLWRNITRHNKKIIETNATDSNLSGCKDEREQSEPTTQSKRIEYSSSRWEQFPTQSPVCSGDDGLPTQLDGITFSKWRAESIKGYGNAIVPQVAYEIFKQLL